MASSWTAVGKSFKPSNALIIAPEQESVTKDEDNYREQLLRKRPNSDSDDEETIRPKKQILSSADRLQKRELDLAWSIDPYGSQDADILYMMKDLPPSSHHSSSNKHKKRSKHSKEPTVRRFVAGKIHEDSYDIIYQNDPYWRKNNRKALLNITLSQCRWQRPIHHPSFPIESEYVPVAQLSADLLSLSSNYTATTNPNNNEFIPDTFLAAEHVKNIKRMFSVAERERPFDIIVSLEHSTALYSIANLEAITNGTFIDPMQQGWIGPKKVDRNVLEQKLVILQACLNRVMTAQQIGNLHHLIKPLQVSIITILQVLKSQEEVVFYVNSACSDLPIDLDLAMLRSRLNKSSFAYSNYQTQLDNFTSFSSSLSQAIKNYYAQLSFTHNIFTSVVDSQAITTNGQTNINQQTLALQILFFRIDLLSSFISYLQAFGKVELSIGLIQAQLMLHLWPLLHPDAGFIVASLSRYWEGEQSRTGEEGYLTGSAFSYCKQQQADHNRSQQLLSEVFADVDTVFPAAASDFLNITVMEVEEGPQPPPPTPQTQTQPKQTYEVERRGSDGAELVYSRLHGYKIWVKPEDASLAYHRILNSLDTTNTDSTKPDKHNNQANKKQLVYSQNDPFQQAYYKDFLGSKLQFRALRALNVHDAQAAEEQPERVVFFDELKPLLLSLPAATADTGNDSSSNSIALIRLIVRLLPALGLHFQHATLSHDTVNSESDRMQSQFDTHQFQDMLTLCDLAVSGKLGYSSDDRNRRIEHLINYLTRAMQAFVIDQDVVDSHKVMIAAQLPKHESRLVFLINKLTSFEALLPSQEAKSMIRKCLIHLNSQQYLIENKLNPSIAADVFQQFCRAVIERSVATSASHHQQQAQQEQQQQHEAVVGDLTLWSQYLLAELQIFSVSNPVQAFRLADRVLKALDDQRKSLLQSTASSSVQIRGAVELYETIAIHFLLCNAANSAMITKTKLLLVQLAFSGMLPTGEHSSVHGVYGGWLKPSSSATGSKKKSPVISVVDQETSVQALQRLQTAAMTQADQLLQQIRQARHNRQLSANSSQLLGVAFISKLDHRQTELLSLFNLTAWLAFLIAKDSSSFKLAVKTADDAFIAAIQLIRDVLLDRLDLSKSASVLSQLHPQAKKQHEMMNVFPISELERHTSEGNDLSVSTAHLLSLRELQLLSEAEMEATKLLESLHLARLQLLLSVGKFNKDHLSSSAAFDQMVINATMHGLHDFPHSHALLMTFTTMQLTRPGGYRCLRHYFATFRQQREATVVEYSATERFYELFAEIVDILQQLAFTAVDSLPAVEQSIDDKVMPDWRTLRQHVHCHLWPEERYHRFTRLCEQAVSNANGADRPWLWRLYLHVQLARGYFAEAKKVALRAIARCGYCKALFMDLLGPLRPACSEEELVGIERIIEQQGMMLRSVSGDCLT